MASAICIPLHINNTQHTLPPQWWAAGDWGSGLLQISTKGLQLEVSELLPQESLTSGNQEFIVTLHCDRSMSTLRIIETLTSHSVGLFTH